MAAGKKLIEAVAALLSPTKGIRAYQVHAQLPEPKPTSRAVRYAMAALEADGRAYRDPNRLIPKRLAQYYAAQRDATQAAE